MKKDVSNYGIDSNLIMKISKDQLEDLYCNQYLSLKKIGKELGIYYTSVSKLIKYYGLTRDKNKAKALAIKVAAKERGKGPDYWKSIISKEELAQYYITEDHSYYDTMNHFKINEDNFRVLLKDYDLNKDKSISCKKGLKTKYKKAGSKLEYNNRIQKKRKETLIKAYGSLENFYGERKAKTEKSNLEKYGSLYKCTADLMDKHSELYQKVWTDKNFSENYLRTFKVKPTVKFLASELNCTENSVHLWLEKFQLSTYVKNIKTGYEEEIISFLHSLNIFNIKVNNRKILKGLELDLFLPDYNLAIEFNGNYYHSSLNKDRHYHFNKSFACEQKGIRLIHIYQYQWDDPVKQAVLKSIITNALGKNSKIIYARKCDLKILSKKDVEEFSINNSIHGHRNASIYLGLFYQEELVEMMSFGKAFFARDFSIDYECIRSITKVNTTVVGGMNKLFKYFIQNYKPNKVLYYVDYNTHNGSSMSKLGFEFKSYSKGGIINIANCKEVLLKYGFAFNRKPQNNKEIQRYIKEGKILSIYDAGVKKYIWTAAV